MTTVARIAAAGAEGLPFAAVAVKALEAFIEQCEQVEEQQEEATFIRLRCQSLINTLIGIPDLDNPTLDALRRSMDTLACEIQIVSTRLTKWESRRWVTRWLKRERMRKALTDGNSRVQNALEFFKLDNEIWIRINGTETVEILKSQRLAEVETHRVTAAGHAATNREALHTFSPSLRLALSAGDDSYGEVQDLDGQITIDGQDAMEGGHLSDVWKGTWRATGKAVAIKAMRAVRVNDTKTRKRFDRQLQVWHTLSHPNIVQFLGICTTAGESRQINLISAWQENGNVLQYLEKDPKGNRLYLMHGTAAGLAYLHAHKIVHGNGKCLSVFRARICDFGLSKIVEEVTSQPAITTMTTGSNSNTRWLAPELVAWDKEQGTESPLTFMTDVYALGMTVLECLTGKRPFPNIKRDAAVVTYIFSEGRPERPSGSPADEWITDDLWSLLRQSWLKRPEERPTMVAFSTRLRLVQKARDSHKAPV